MDVVNYSKPTRRTSADKAITEEYLVYENDNSNDIAEQAGESKEELADKSKRMPKIARVLYGVMAIGMLLGVVFVYTRHNKKMLAEKEKENKRISEEAKDKEQ